jgi:hypothetical protein
LDQRNVRIVVGRGDPSGTDIRATLEDDGFQVAGEASSAAELARLVSADPPDVVVLDDTIGVAAVQAVAELAPHAKLVVIWPAAVLPIAGATRIDAAQVHTALAPAVAAAAGFAIGMTTIDRPEWIDAARKDPATLREKLAESGGTHPQPSVTELQRPHAHRAAATGWRRRRTAAVAVAAAAATVGAPVTSASAAAATQGDATVNRRLGIVALGGAVAAGALMIALSFGRTPPTLVTAERFVPSVSAPSNVAPNPPDGSTTGGGGPGAPNGGGQQAGGGGANGGTGTGGGAGAPTIGAGGTTSGTSGSGSGSGSTGGRTGQEFPQRQGVAGGGPSTDGSGLPSTDGGGGPSTGDGSSPGGNGSGGGQAGGNGATSAPGKSGEHNPHGGPPGQLHHGGHGHGAGHGHAGHPDHPDHPDHPSRRVRP